MSAQRGAARRGAAHRVAARRAVGFLAAAAMVVSPLGAASGAGAPALREFPVPQGSHPHDVYPAPDGTIWYTAHG